MQRGRESCCESWRVSQFELGGVVPSRGVVARRRRGERLWFGEVQLRRQWRKVLSVVVEKELVGRKQKQGQR